MLRLRLGFTTAHQWLHHQSFSFAVGKCLLYYYRNEMRRRRNFAVGNDCCTCDSGWFHAPRSLVFDPFIMESFRKCAGMTIIAKKSLSMLLPAKILRNVPGSDRLTGCFLRRNTWIFKFEDPNSDPSPFEHQKTVIHSCLLHDNAFPIMPLKSNLQF